MKHGRNIVALGLVACVGLTACQKYDKQVATPTTSPPAHHTCYVQLEDTTLIEAWSSASAFDAETMCKVYVDGPHFKRVSGPIPSTKIVCDAENTFYGLHLTIYDYPGYAADDAPECEKWKNFQGK